MKTLIVFDSYFGNTEKVAQAIGAALAGQADVQVVKIDEADAAHLDDVQQLIVGSPTRQFRHTRAVRGFLQAMPAGALQGKQVAAFDTRIDLADIHSAVGRFFVGTFGYAAHPIAQALQKKGGKLVAAPEGFLVTGSEGPLKPGELERAAIWAGQIGAAAARIEKKP